MVKGEKSMPETCETTSNNPIQVTALSKKQEKKKKKGENEPKHSKSERF